MGRNLHTPRIKSNAFSGASLAITETLLAATERAQDYEQPVSVELEEGQVVIIQGPASGTISAHI